MELRFNSTELIVSIPTDVYRSLPLWNRPTCSTPRPKL